MTPWTAAHQASLCITNSQSLLKLMSIEWMMPTNHLILCHPFLLPSIFPSIRVFSSESVLHIRWLKYWSFRFSISPSNEYSGLISFRMEWLDLLAVQGIVRSLLQHHSSKASILWGIQSQPAQSRPLGLGFWALDPLPQMGTLQTWGSQKNTVLCEHQRQSPWSLGTSLERPRDPGMNFMSSDPQGRGLYVSTGSGVQQPAFVYFFNWDIIDIQHYISSKRTT